jgi:MFS family permease
MNLFGWWAAGDAVARRALVAAALGWALDAFDVMLYALVSGAIMRDLRIGRDIAGALQSATLLAAAAGGLIFGVVADRYGRTRALMGSVLIYSVFTAACGLAHSVAALALFRIGLGIGMGGEWASGAALVSETWPAEHRGKALGFMQSAWAIGYAAAAAVNWLVLPRYGWRAVFFVGILPAFLTFWIRRHVSEPTVWQDARRAGSPRRPAAMFEGPMLPLTAAVTVMNAFCLFAWWGFNQWVPNYLSTPVAAGGIGLSTETMSGFVIAMQVGMWFGYVTFGYIGDAFGRKRTYVFYLVAAAVLIAAYVSVKLPTVLLLLGPLVAFFATGFFSGFGAVTAEIYPTSIRATAQGFTYNMGRIASAAAPYTVGTLAQSRGLGAALLVTSVAYLCAAATWTFIPETRGRELIR